MELRKHYYRCCCCCFSPTGTATLVMKMMTCLLLLLLLLLNSNSAVIAFASAATGQLHPTAAEEGVYDIDYRGPETHSAVFPPPGHSQIQGRPNFLLHHRSNGVLAPAAAVPITSRRQPPDQHKY
ncbi:unnamed protein product [Linum trigynum]|uniref:Uncharacterized protein n=1 Tax=Linum trigynum TaxID=586398 RepID=A0AAV2FMP6_9ROSI